LNLPPTASHVNGNGFTDRREEHHPIGSGPRVGSTGGSRTHRIPGFEPGRFASLRTVPSLSPTSAPGGIRTRDLLADNEASTPDCSTKASSMAQEGVEPSASLVLSESSLPIAYRAGRDLNPGATTQGGSRTHRRPGLSRAARPVGVPGRLAAEAVGLEPTSGPRPPPVFKTMARQRARNS
jgi:hypothetical protein